MEPRLHVTIVGEPAFEYEGRRVRTMSRKADALLAFLCVCDTGEVTRQFAAGLLWSGSSEDHARTSLRQAVRSIRSALEMAGFDGFHARKDALALDRLNVGVDLTDILASVRLGILPCSESLHRLRYGNRILQGCDDLDDSFSAWVRVQRQLWSDLLLDALDGQFRSSLTEARERERWARAIVAFDPSHEPATRHVMQAQARQGNHAGALQIYKVLRRTLAEEFDVEPASETQALHAAIKCGRMVVETPETRPNPARMSLKDDGPVLIVADVEMAENPASCFARMLGGLRFELISLLVRFREWTVVDWGGWIAPSSRRETYTILLSGRMAGNEIAYGLNLRDERTGRFVWGETLRGGVASLYEEQEAFVRRMAATMNMHLSAERLRRPPTHAALAGSHFDAWVRVQQHLYELREADDSAAFELLQSIIRDAPGFSPAHSALAQLANGRHMARPGIFLDSTVVRTALGHARMARRLDPLDARAHLSLGSSHALLGEFAAADDAYRSALQLNGNDSWVLTTAAHGLALAGEGRRVDELTRRILDLGVTLAPRHWSYLAGLHYLAGDYAQCVAASSQAAHGYHGMRAWEIAALHALGETGRAAEAAARIYRSLEEDWRSPEPPSPRLAGDWLVDAFPIREETTRRRVRSSLASAGLR